MQTGKVTEHLGEMIQRQVDEKGIVVWYDPDQVYAGVIEHLALVETTLVQYQDSYLRLRRAIEPFPGWIDAEGQPVKNCGVPPRLLVYVPVDRGKTDGALLEAEAAGAVMCRMSRYLVVSFHDN